MRASVALVTQRPILFSIPLRDNLTAARPDAPWHEVVAACEAAGVSHFAAELPDSYDTLIGPFTSPGYKTQLEDVAGIEVLDERTVRFRFKKPNRTPP